MVHLNAPWLAVVTGGVTRLIEALDTRAGDSEGAGGSVVGVGAAAAAAAAAAPVLAPAVAAALVAENP